MVVGVSVVVALVWHFGGDVSTAYHAYKCRAHVAQAAAALEAGDDTGAAIACANALRHDSRDAAAWKMFAQVAARRGGAEQAEIYRRALEVNRGDTNLARRLVRVCVEQAAFGVADAAMPLLTNDYAADGLIWQELGRLELRRGRPAEALRYLEAARHTGLEGMALDFDRAVAQLRWTNEAERVAAVVVIERAVEDPALAEVALRLLADYWETRDVARAMDAWRRLAERRPNDWSVALDRVDAVRRMRPAEAVPLLVQMHYRASNVVEHGHTLQRVLAWEGARYASTWIDDIPAEIRAHPLVAQTVIQVWAAEGRWTEVIPVAVEQTRRQAPPAELVPFWVWLIRAHRAAESHGAARLSSRTAANLLSQEPDLSLRAGEFLLDCRLPEDAVDFFVGHTNAPAPVGDRALARLLRAQQLRRDGPGMLATAEELVRRRPGDAEFLDILTGLLISEGRDAGRALTLASGRYATAPANAVAGVNFARALLAMNQNADALAVFNRLPADVLKLAEPRLYYAEALMRNGRTNEAILVASGVPRAKLLENDARVLERLIGPETNRWVMPPKP